jgi:hypothetical protein
MSFIIGFFFIACANVFVLNLFCELPVLLLHFTILLTSCLFIMLFIMLFVVFVVFVVLCCF